MVTYTESELLELSSIVNKPIPNIMRDPIDIAVLSDSVKVGLLYRKYCRAGNKLYYLGSSPFSRSFLTLLIIPLVDLPLMVSYFSKGIPSLILNYRFSIGK